VRYGEDMIALVRLALTRPYTFIVMAAMIAIIGTLAAIRTPIDIFPNISVPVVAVAWQYNGLSPSDMSGRILTPYERVLTSTVNDIQHIEANSLTGVGIVKIFLQPGADVRLANAQVTAVSQAILRQLPQGVQPPLILNYNASTVPVIQLALSGVGLNEQQLYDLGQNFLRTGLVTVPGAGLPFPFGGKPPQLQIDINPAALQSKGVSAQDVAAALSAQTQITPAGFVKIGAFQYNLRLNNAPGTVAQLSALPIKTVNGTTIHIGDVATVRSGAAPQQNIVHVDGQRSVLMTVFKSGATSTIAIVDGIKEMVPQLLVGLPPALKVTPLNDQSIFVKAAVQGVVREGVLAAALTSLMILLFLGSWRSTVIIALSIPLAVLAAVAVLAAFGQTLNIMTLGGLALAVGILVDDATVTIENINWHLEHGKKVKTAILDGAKQIVTPAFVSLLCICIVFVPMFFLPGVSGFLFVPMALSVVFAMVASFILSRTFVPTMAAYLLKPHRAHTTDAPKQNTLGRFQQRFERGFGNIRRKYVTVLEKALAARGLFVAGFLAIALLSLGLVPFLGRDFFPTVDSGSMLLHVSAPPGTRIEETAALFDHVERQIRQIVPAGELASIVDDIGVSTSGINVTYDTSGIVGPMDGNIFISLNEHHAATQTYIDAIRKNMPRLFPTAVFSFLPADITSQILNFGAPTAIDIQVTGRKLDADQAYAQKLLREVRKVDGIADAHIQQSSRYPELRFDADRTRINSLGLQEVDITNSVADAVAGTSQTAPLYWLNPDNGVSYPVVAQAPEYRIDTLDKLQTIPVSSHAVSQPDQVLGGLGDLSRGETVSVASQYNINPLINVYASVTGRDLGGVAGDVQTVMKRLDTERPKGVTVTLRGQYETMNSAFSGMALGLIGAIVMIYLIIVINFQSWSDPFVIVSALPAALAGICWMLFFTDTPLSVPALTGAIMCMGVATANSILVVSFAREKLVEIGDSFKAALEAGSTRFRPVLMTALAMIIGMAPMALGLGEGGEQNAPLGRAVIGGLLFATCASLLFVPTVFALVHRNYVPATAADGDDDNG
jgi:CzcA family heavy metal efflux pump